MRSGNDVVTGNDSTVSPVVPFVGAHHALAAPTHDAGAGGSRSQFGVRSNFECIFPPNKRIAGGQVRVDGRQSELARFQGWSRTASSDFAPKRTSPPEFSHTETLNQLLSKP